MEEFQIGASPTYYIRIGQDNIKNMKDVPADCHDEGVVALKKSGDAFWLVVIDSDLPSCWRMITS